MEVLRQVASGFDGGVLKEPRGFIKLIEFVVAIFAFATTASFSSSTTFTITCNGTKVSKYTLDYAYPFDLTSVGVTVPVPVCNTSATSSFRSLDDSVTSSSQFYVFVGVMTFLYCIAALILYLFFDDFYRKKPRVVIGDFVISVVLTALWLISSSAWAQGVSDVKYYTDPADSGFFKTTLKCGDNQCAVSSLGNFAGLNVSIIFGFLNFLVWGGTLWFVYKETPWFKISSKPAGSPAEPPQPTPTNQY